MLRVAVLGDTESIQGFAAIGLDIFPCDDPGLAPGLFHRLCGGEYGVVYITEELAALLEKEIKKQEEAMVPAVIPIPGVKGNTGLGIRRLSQSVEKAVGADIIFQ